VFFDLADESRPGYEESHALLADWLPDSLEICLTDEIYNEINRNKIPEQRKRSREIAQSFVFPPSESIERDELERSLRKYFPETMTDRDESDLRQLARTIAAGIQFFITRDEPLLDRSEEIYTAFGVSILRPSDFIIRFDQLRREAAYQPARLAGTLTSIQLLNSSNTSPLLKNFLACPQGETKESFKKRLHQFLADPERYKCYVTLNVEQLPSSLFVHDRQRSDSLEVPLFRVSRGPLAATMIRYLLFRSTLESSRENRALLALLILTSKRKQCRLL
jgi:predicted nucleic acid-binding protein